MDAREANYGIKLDCDPISEHYLFVGSHPELGYVLNASKMADFLRLNGVTYFDGRTIAFYQNKDYNHVNLREIILRSLPSRENGLPYYIKESSIEETIALWKQGWVSDPGKWELIED